MKSANPVNQRNPILTIKIKDVTIQSQIGRNWFIEVAPVEFETNNLRIRRGKQNTFILQSPWDTKNPPSVSIRIKVTEKDKISDIFGPKEFSLEIDKTLPIDNDPKPEIISGHRKVKQTISFTVEGLGGDKGKTATIQILFEWFLSSNMNDLVSYIHNEMINNLNTPEFADLKNNLEIANRYKIIDNYLLATIVDVPTIISKSAVYYKFINLVGYNKQWDHKPAIYLKCGEWSLDSNKGQLYRFDIFSNIHYGYIGKAAGFTENELLDAAGLAQLLNNGDFTDFKFPLRKSDDPIDQEAIKLGINIWEEYKKTVSKDVLLQKIRNKIQWKGGRINADEGRKTTI